jgi:hypothetical protein
MTDREQVSQISEQVLSNAILLRQLSDRVYELLREEIHNQRDRLGLGRSI